MGVKTRKIATSGSKYSWWMTVPWPPLSCPGAPGVHGLRTRVLGAVAHYTLLLKQCTFRKTHEMRAFSLYSSLRVMYISAASVFTTLSGPAGHS